MLASVLVSACGAGIPVDSDSNAPRSPTPAPGSPTPPPTAPEKPRIVGAVKAIAVDGASYFIGGTITDITGASLGRIAKLDATGKLAPFFGEATPPAKGGAAGDLPKGFDADVNALLIAPDSSHDIYVGGEFSFYNGATTAISSSFLTRLTANGDVAPTFSVGTGLDAAVKVIAATADGSGDVYVGGKFTQFNGTAVGRIVRISATGSMVGSFATGTGFDGDVNAIALAADGSKDLYVGGSFTKYKGTATGGIVRLTETGNIDAGFSTGAGFDKAVNTLLAIPGGTGKVYAGGAFTTYKGAKAGGIIALNPDGSSYSSFTTGKGFDQPVTGMAVADATGAIFVIGSFTTLGNYPSPRLIKLSASGIIQSAIKIGKALDNTIETIVPLPAKADAFLLGGAFSKIDDVPLSALGMFLSSGARDTTFSP